jgi:transcription antitermination factor NusG
VGYWAAAQLQPQRDRLAAHFLSLAGFVTYYPRIRVARPSRPDGSSPLFTGYMFVQIESQWHVAERSPGVIRLVKADGGRPAHVADAIIGDLRRREDIDGLIALPAPPRLRRGAKVLITKGPFTDKVAIYQGMKPQQRVEVLLTMLGAQRQLMLPKGAILPAP